MPNSDHLPLYLKLYQLIKFLYEQLDICGFFMAIEHHILYSLLEKMIFKQNKSYQWKEDILWLTKTIVFYKPMEENKEKLKLWRDKVNDFLKENLKLELSLKKQKIQPLEKGINFLPAQNYSFLKIKYG